MLGTRKILVASITIFCAICSISVALHFWQISLSPIISLSLWDPHWSCGSVPDRIVIDSENANMPDLNGKVVLVISASGYALPTTSIKQKNRKSVCQGVIKKQSGAAFAEWLLPDSFFDEKTPIYFIASQCVLVDMTPSEQEYIATFTNKLQY